MNSACLVAGAAADRMSIEVRRREDDGVEGQYVIGRPNDADEPLSIAPEIGASVTDVHPTELFVLRRILD